MIAQPVCKAGAREMRRGSRICVVGEWLRGAADEGIRNLSRGLIEAWREDYQVSEIVPGLDVPTDRLFLGARLCRALRDAHPGLVFYISPACARSAALLRARVLKAYAPRAKVLVVALQPVEYSRAEKRLLPLLSPDGILVQSRRSMRALDNARCRVTFLPSGVDLERFAPVPEARKRELREKYEVEAGAFVLLHVGHINRNRNAQWIEYASNYKEEGKSIRGVVVGSTSTPQDQELAGELRRAGVTLICDFQPNIEEIYQLADAYLFPVVSDDAAIGVPLSVLEAMACDLPVITTRFGGLPLMFQRGDGVHYLDNALDLMPALHKVISSPRSHTRRLVEPYGWRSVARLALQSALPEVTIS